LKETLSKELYTNFLFYFQYLEVGVNGHPGQIVMSTVDVEFKPATAPATPLPL
jgi:hypothetical protein